VIFLVSSDPRLRDVLDEAVAMWRGCSQFGVGFPRLETIENEAAAVRPGERPGRRVVVALGNREHPGRGSRCGTFQGSSIVLHRRTVDELGRPHSCGALEATLAHEIGHALGVEHTEPGAQPGDQSEQVMTGTIMPNVKRPGRVMTSECGAVDRHWMTSLELAGARSLGFVPPESVSGRPLVEAAAAWHEAVAMGLVDSTNPAGRTLASRRKPTPVAVP
jgi:hypothetical protein